MVAMPRPGEVLFRKFGSAAHARLPRGWCRSCNTRGGVRKEQGAVAAQRAAMSLFRTRLSSFAVGFASASAFGTYLLRRDVQRDHDILVQQVRFRRLRALPCVAVQPPLCR